MEKDCTRGGREGLWGSEPGKPAFLKERLPKTAESRQALQFLCFYYETSLIIVVQACLLLYNPSLFYSWHLTWSTKRQVRLKLVKPNYLWQLRGQSCRSSKPAGLRVECFLVSGVLMFFAPFTLHLGYFYRDILHTVDAPHLCGFIASFLSFRGVAQGSGCLSMQP